MTVADHLKQIIQQLKAESHDGDLASHSRAFAYGYAVGTLQKTLEEWQRHLSGGDPSGA